MYLFLHVNTRSANVRKLAPPDVHSVTLFLNSEIDFDSHCVTGPDNPARPLLSAPVSHSAGSATFPSDLGARTTKNRPPSLVTRLNYAFPLVV